MCFVLQIERNRWATSHLSHLALIPLEKLFSEQDGILVYKHLPDQTELLPHAQHRPGPDDPHWKIATAEWSTVLHRIDQGEPLRKGAGDYGVSQETIRRIIFAARKRSAD